MKSFFLLGLVGLFSLGSVIDAEACHRRRCGGGHHRRGCGNGCYSQPYYMNGGCQTYGGQVYGGQGYGGGQAHGGVYVDPNVAPGAAVEGGAAVDANVAPPEPVPAK